MTLMFIAIVLFAACLAWAMMPDAGVAAIRKRVLGNVATEERPTVLGQLVELLAPINRYLPTGWYSVHIWRLLQAAGLRTPAIHFFVLQEIAGITGFFLYFMIYGPQKANVVWLTVFVVGCFLMPYLWLNNRIASRRQSVSRDLPEVVDLLSLCVDAGLDFMNSLNRIIREFRHCPTTDELGIMMQEVRVGKRRRDALRAFSTRLQTAESSSFSRTLIQADRMGTGITEALRILSEDMRVQRTHWAERFAQQAPVKMLLPLLFSLASALIIVAGPILGQFLKGGFNVGSYSEGSAK